ncbi:hypothetical protein [Kordiimonas laminariae]|uniref:hypothetical protein n=1 Tax=Kordiimonas laminariae TaxID=2917717 RepID=UPI001FF2AC61|nr:hypothetical protein [Kordiimonas laminariae]MCK0068773.1 hypothetical protein [Kordiimonas laminariae]
MKNVILTLATTALVSTAAIADDSKKFDGFFTGVETGYVFSGSSDVFIYGGNIGYRNQSETDIVFGVEGTFSGTDVNGIDFLASTTLTIGQAFGSKKNQLFYLGAGYALTKTDFGYNGAFKSDLGYEYALDNGFSIRLKATTYEFDEFQTTAGFAYRF